MRHSRCAIAAVVVSLLVFIAATLTFVTSYFGFPEAHPLAPLISLIIFLIFLSEIPLIPLSRYLGFPLVLPALTVLLAFLSFRAKEHRKTLTLFSVGLVLVSILMYLALRSVTYQPAGAGRVGSQERPARCTLEAQRCPDGSYVERVPPKCEFAPCQ